MHTVIEAIKSRYSVRTFDSKALSQEDLEQCQHLVEAATKCITPFKHLSQFQIADKHSEDSGKAIGTYGIIKNPQKYIVGLTTKEEFALVDFGYAFEYLVIELTRRDIGTCWLGGTFKRDMFLDALDLQEEQIMPAVIPIGYLGANQRLFEKMMRLAVNANNKKPWKVLFFDRDFGHPLEEDSVGLLHTAFENVRIGPSASNKQPWRLVFDKESKSVHFYLAYDPKYAGNRLGFSMQHIDMGIAMAHFEMTMHELKIEGSWKTKKPRNSKAPKEVIYISTFQWR